MTDEQEIRLSVAIMHHPSRGHRIPALRASCAPLRARVVTDPDPGGLPSPLRTAKHAWAAIEEGASHHLVLQDDVVLTDGFAARLADAVAERPMHALALYSNWNSPQNSYLVRRAAAVGSPWAPLSPDEWTPTMGLVMPTEHARDLAKYLAELPDDVRDDDEMVAAFCRERGIRVVATVPHLVDHTEAPTIAGHPGSFHATVLPPDDDPPSGRAHWAAAPGAEEALARRAAHQGVRDFVLELTDSRCRIRFVRPGSAEPVEHPYGWYWYDWAPLIGVVPDAVLGLCEAYLRTEGGRRTTLPLAREGTEMEVLTEVWAAGYLLGHDAETTGVGGQSGHTAGEHGRDRERGREPGRDPAWDARTHETLLRGVLASWVDSGLLAEDRTALSAAARTALVDLAMEALPRGRAAGRERPHAGR